MATEFADRLAGMQNAWATGKDTAPGVPEGLYTMQLLEAGIAASQSSGKLMIKRTHTVVGGEQDGETVYDNLMLETDMGMFFVARWVEQMGFEVPDNIAELEEVVSAISEANPVYTAQVKKSGDFTNVRVRELLEATADVAKEEEEEPEENASDFAEGEVVTFDMDGTEVSGTIVGFDGDDAHVEDSDGEVWAVPMEDLQATTEEETAPEEDETLVALLAFAQAADIEVDDTATVEQLTEAIGAYSYPREELTDEEAALLENIGISPTEPPEPKPKAAVKKKTTARRKK